MKLTIAYVTNRRAPMFSWFVESLCDQTTPEQRGDLQVVFIDGCLWGEHASASLGMGDIPLAAEIYHSLSRHREVADAVAGRFQFLHIPPKPCAYQGPFRQTTRDMFCAGSSRNTAFLVADAPYVVFVDDLSVLMPGWFNNVMHAVNDDYIVCGMYRKVLELAVSTNPFRVSWKDYPPGVDSRWPHGSDGGVVPWHGSGMFGCSFGVPLEAALEVDGNDCAHHGQGGEDTDLGIRLERAGWPVFLNRNMLTLESEEMHHGGSKLPMERKLVSREMLPKAYDSYVIAREDEKYYSDHVVLNRLNNETDRILPLIGEGLREQREYYRRTGLVRLPLPNQVDWRDGKPISEL